MAMKPSMRIVFRFLYLLALATINLSFCSEGTSPDCIETDRQALLSFKKDIKDPSNQLASWSTGDGDCCTWAGVVCDNLTGHVLELHLQNPFDRDFDSEYDYEAYESSKLGGKINPSLLDLKDLIYLNLSNNDFGGSQIPKFLGFVGNLTYLDLSGAGFTGMIPHQLGNLSNLRYLDLSANFYDENLLYVENLFWLSSLSLLEHLDLSNANLSKTPDWFLVTNDLPALEVLILRECQLRHFSPLPIVNFSSLTILDLTYNKFGSPIPSWIFGLSNLVFLSLSSNNFQGPIPDGLQNLTSLRHFDLSYNFFNSSLPNWLYKFSHLEYLSLDAQCRSDSVLEGNIPRSLGILCNLKSVSLFCVKLNQSISEILDILSECASNKLELLDLRHGHLFGNLTNQLGKFKNLVRLELGYNSISGHIPSSLGELSSLEVLDLRNNKLDGTISEIHFANLVNLFYFDAFQNSLTFKINPNWIPPFQLESIDLNSCHLGPQFPQWLQSQKKLGYVDISNSGILDIFPSRLFRISQIFFLNLSHNHIHGEIPSLTESPNLRLLDLSSNKLSGPLPLIPSTITQLDLSNNNLSGSIFQFLCHEKNKSNQMQILNLEANFIFGEIPNCWTTWQSLRYLNLGNNKFTGNLPISLKTLSSLKSLHLRKNNLSGKIPALKTSELEILEVGENQFVGGVPTWIGERFSRLKILNLRSNKFNGDLPEELCHLSSLQILDVAYNNLSGTIPRCINNFSAMVKVNYSLGNDIKYSSNYSADFVEDSSLVMKGQMLEYSTILNLIRTIDLSSNNFFGEIPIEVTDLGGLQSLNLSHNFLSGRIPSTIGAMTFIESIDFSSNKLSGEIPYSIASLTFLSRLNLSQNNLTGRIPSGTQLQSFDASYFTNNDLCGLPLPNNCTETTSPVPNIENRGKDGNGHEVDWFYVSIPLGFMVGFWSVIGPLLVNRRWRYVYYHFMDVLGNKFWGFVEKLLLNTLCC